MQKEVLVVEVVGAHNLMPKDGEGSSSAFVEVEFENQILRTQVKTKDLNPIWNEKLVFHVADVADLPYRNIDVVVYNERKSGNSRNFLGKVRVSGSCIVKEGEEVVQIYTLDKRSLFSHIRGEISLKFYLTTKLEANATVVKNNDGNGTTDQLKRKKQQPTTPSTSVMAMNQAQQQKIHKNNNQPQPNQQQQGKPNQNPNPGPVVVATGPGLGSGIAQNPVPAPIPGGFHGFSDFLLKETNPHLGGGIGDKDKTSSTYDLVEQMQYLYIRVVKGKNFSGEVNAEVKFGNYRGVTSRVGSAEWDQVFAFPKDGQSSIVEIFVKDKDKDDFLGRVWFDLNEVPKRVPPDSQLAPQWYAMEDKKGEKLKGGEVMVAVWLGTQADEMYDAAWHAKAADVHFDGLSSIKSKVYLSPKLWYLRVSIIEAQDLVPGDKGAGMRRFPELTARAQVGNQVLRTGIAPVIANRSPANPVWNEDMMFVVAEPFEDYLMVCVEHHVAPGRDEILGRILYPVGEIDRRLDNKPVVTKWLDLDMNPNNNMKMANRFRSRIHLRLSLDGGYHVLDESTMYSSDVRPTAKQLWKPHIGVLEMGILGASGLMPMKIKEGKGGSADAYCIAKYGQKWVRTRTVVDSLVPKWNEQYTWEVFDPCTVITVGVFDNCHLDKNTTVGPGARDSRIGKVRIRLSTLESDRVYTHAYPLLMLHPSGVKKMGELHLAIRFSCPNLANVLHMYMWPLLPMMHYDQPLTVNQLESLRYQAMNVVAARLSRAEPPLGREVVEYMLDHDSHMWSMRRSKANFFRLISVISGVFAAGKWLESMRSWEKPVYSTTSLIIFLVLVFCPELILPMILLYAGFLGLWRFRTRSRHPPHMDIRLSHAESVYPDELDEEFDTFPTSRSAEIVRMRYDRLRSVAGRIQIVVGDLAMQGERFQALVSWRDPRATFLFVLVCFIAAVGFYFVPFQIVVALWVLYEFRPPRFRNRLPSPALSFFRRLPTRADSLL